MVKVADRYKKVPDTDVPVCVRFNVNGMPIVCGVAGG